MNNPRIVRRLKDHRKKAISPVIATIILIAVALIMALVVGVFAFGLFTSNAHSITIKDAVAYQTAAANTGTCTPNDSCLAVTFNNPGTTINTQVNGTLTGGSQATQTVTFASIPVGVTTVYFDLGVSSSSVGVTSGVQYDLTVNLPSGQPLTATVIAQ